MENKIIKNITKIRVRYADTDKMGIVYNGVYLTYFEVGRTELMRAHGLPYSVFEKEGYWLPLVESHVEYKRSANYDDLLDVEAALNIDEISATLKFIYNIYCNDSLIASGYTVHSFLKAETRKPVRPPVFFLNSLKNIK